MSWKAVPSASGYGVRWRRTDSNQWQESLVEPDRDPRLGVTCKAAVPKAVGNLIPVQGTPTTAPSECGVILDQIRVDDWVFGVSSVSKDGFESPVASAVPGGAFKPYVKPAETK